MQVARFLGWSFFVVSVSFTGCLLMCGDRTLRAEDFPQPFNTQDEKDVLSTPAAALKSIKLPDGFRATLFAAEPTVQQPIAITTDERGRLWVAENYTYAESKTNFETKLRDRIVILEDTDGDGVSDKRTVFWDKGVRLTSVEVGFGGVWVLCAPHLLFIPDRNRDDVPDGEPIVVLDGWDTGAIRHNIVNGLKWGPDGWLYGRHGILATSIVGKPGATESQRTKINCGIWRYHPTREQFEVVAWGGTNAWGFDYDDHGQMFYINTVIGHLWHIVPGAHYRRMYGVDFDRHTYQLLEQTADHFHWDTGEAWNDIRKGVSKTTAAAGGGHAHSGLMIYLGDNWPTAYRGRLFTVNLHGQRLNQDLLQRQGAGYVGKHAPDFLTVGDAWFRGLEMIYGADGGVYIADWTDVGECHENDGVHRTSGRIFKVTYGKPTPMLKLDLVNKTNLELVELQTHKNDWYVRQARRILQERAAAKQNVSDARANLLRLFSAEADVRIKLRALWCLAAIGCDEDFLVTLLQHPEEHVRVWGVRLLMDRTELSRSAIANLTKLARHEASGLVQLFLTAALQRLPAKDRWEIAESLANQEPFATDPMLPLMVWYGIGPAVSTDPLRAVKLAKTTSMPIVRKHLARRLAEEIEEHPETLNTLLEFVANGATAAVQHDILLGVSEALRGWRKATPPQAWSAVQQRLATSEHETAKALGRELSVVFGDGRAVSELTSIVNDGKQDVEIRRNALRTLVETKSDSLLPMLQKLVANRELSTEAIRGLAYYQDANVPRLILDNFPRLNLEGKSEAINTLTSRPGYAKELLLSLQNKKVGRNEVSAYHARQIRNFENNELNQLLIEHWGDVRPTPNDKAAAILQWKAKLSPANLNAGDLSAGRQTFHVACANCHVLYGQGRKVGPDLTGANRQNLDYLLENILDPSATVAVDFRTTVAVMKDGRSLTGVVGDQDDKTVTLEMQKERTTLLRNEIEELRATNLSLMPDGLLNNLSAEQVRDLVAYLRSREQVLLPVPEPQVR